jgi:raffinose/stachyose/melibiose transport system permease protein
MSVNVPARRDDAGLWGFAVPALALVSGVMLLPSLLTIAASFTYWDGVSRPAWAGLSNYVELARDVEFWRATVNNLRWTVLFLTVPMAAALLTACLLLTRPAWQAPSQVILLIPYVLSPIANVAIWTGCIFDPISGVFALFSRHLWHLPSPLAHPATALYGVAAIDMWHFWGYLTVIFLGALRQVPADQIEAARLDGASAWQLFRFVTLPAIAPTIAVTFVIVTIFSFLTFDYVYLSTGGGPGYSTEVLSVFAYTLAFSALDVGKAAAVALVIGVFGLAASLVYMRLSWSEL